MLNSRTRYRREGGSTCLCIAKVLRNSKCIDCGSYKAKRADNTGGIIKRFNEVNAVIYAF